MIRRSEEWKWGGREERRSHSGQERCLKECGGVRGKWRELREWLTKRARKR
jgi:hypothetical protein